MSDSVPLDQFVAQQLASGRYHWFIHTVLAQREGLTEVLSNDRHFEQEGFVLVFRD